MSAGAWDADAGELVAVDEDVGQVILEDELDQIVSGGGMRPSVFVAVGDDQTPALSSLLEAAIVIGAAPTAILNTVLVVVVVNHFVEQGGGNFLDGAGQGTGSDVDFMGAAQFGDPCVFPQGEVTVCSRSGLDGDGWS